MSDLRLTLPRASLLALLSTLLLSACGGGGGAEGPAPPPAQLPPLSSRCETGSVARVAIEASPRQGRNTELALLSCGGPLSAPRWTQSGGAALNPLSARSFALTVEPASAGPYRFSVAFNDSQGRAHSGQLEFSAQPAAEPALTLRGEPSVYSGGRFSLRAWWPDLDAGQLDSARLSWTQLEGPALDLTAETGWRLVLQAPTVGSDSLLRLRATATLADGSRRSGEFSLLIQALPAAPVNQLFKGSNAASRVYPWLAGGPHAPALAECIYSPQISWSNPNNLCTLGRLPLLGQANPGAVPTVEQIMQRVLVSNDWMAEVFEQFLREEDTHGDYRRMLASVTAVVIGGRVRPAFYWNTTGAIYLDGAYLWLTPEQRDTLSEAPDPRSDYGALLGYAMPWRYTLDNRHATDSLAVVERRSRTLAQIRYELGRLLYHELAHAADFLPPRVHGQLAGGLYVYQASPTLTASQNLQLQLPFFSQEMKRLADVLSFGATPTAQQIAYTPSDIVQFFSQDRVNDDYSYSIPEGATFSREDTAMLLEEAMMQLRYGVMRDVAVTDKLPAGGNSADLIVSWGQRGRIGEAAIKPRLQLVLAELMPWVESSLVAQLRAPQPLRSGISWGANLDLSGTGGSQPLSAQARFNEEQQTTAELRRRARALQAR